MAGTVATPQYTIADDDEQPKPKFTVGDETPNIASESAMAAHPPTPKITAAMKPSYSTMALSNSPSGADPHNPGNPNLNAIPESERENINTNALSTAVATTPFLEAGPLAGAFESRVIPSLQHIPIVGRSIRAVQAAPTIAGKVISGATQGAGYGGLEGLIRGKGVIPSLEDAAKGGLVGAGMGLALPAIGGIAKYGPGVFRAPEEAAVAAEGIPRIRTSPFEGMTATVPGTPATAPIAAMEPPRIATGPISTTGVPAGTRIAPITAPEAPVAQAAIPERVAPVSAPTPVTEPMQVKPLAERSMGEQKGTRTTIGSVVNEAAGVKPLKADVPIREQLTKVTAAEPAEIDPLKAKYPDSTQRQLVRANGEKIYEAAKGNPELLKSIHDLTRVDLRQALINSGEDMGQTTVSNSKFAGEGSIPREEAFNRLLQKGHTPEDIVKLAKQVPRGTPSTVFRAQDVGNPELSERAPAHATESEEEAQKFAEGRQSVQGKPQEVKRINLGNMKQGTDYTIMEGPRGNRWIKFHRQLQPHEFEP